MASKRLGSVDIAKGIAIIAIVVGHIGIFSAEGVELSQPWVFTFHVPVFFVIAGYFLSDKLPLGAFVAQKAKRLLLPYAATAVCVVLGVALISVVGNGSTWPSMYAQVKDAALAALYGSGSWYVPTPFSIPPIGAIWFLPALFFALIIGRVTMMWKYGWIATIPLAVAAFLTARMFWLPLNLQPACVASLFVVFGRFLRKRDFLAKKPDWLVMLGCAAVFVVAGIYNLKLSVASLLTAGPVLVSLGVAAACSVLCLNVSQLLDDYREKGTGVAAKVLEYFGKGSLTVLCVHLFITDLGINSFMATTFGLTQAAYTIVLLVVHLGLTAACITLFRKTPGLRALWP